MRPGCALAPGWARTLAPFALRRHATAIGDFTGEELAAKRGCEGALEESEAPFTDAHALSEMFAALTGFYKVTVAAATELTLDLKSSLLVGPLPLADYEKAIGEAHRRGVMGDDIYDSLHATFARRKGAKRVVTRNPSHFAHAAPDLEILPP